MGNPRLDGVLGLEQGRPGPVPKPEAVQFVDLAASAATVIGADQSGREKAGCAVSVVDQNVAGGSGGAGMIVTESFRPA